MPTIELSQGPVSYEDRGTGRPVVFLHPFMVDGRLWRDVAPAVAEHARAVVPTLPLGAHQLPMRPDAELSPPAVARLVAELIEALDLSDVVLVGNDMGGAIAQLVVANHPERIGALVLAPSDAFENFPPKFFKSLLLLARIPGAVRALSEVIRFKPVWRTPAAFGWVLKRPVEDALLASWVRPLRASAEIRRDLGKLLGGLDPGQLVEASTRFAAFRGPVVLCWAREDRFFPPADAERLAAAFGDARIEWVEDAYTFVALDQPAAAVGAIRGVLARDAEARAAV